MNRLPLLRRLALLLGAGLLAFFAARSIFGERGLIEVARQESELERIRAEVESARARNEELIGQISRLREGKAAVERLARERLGYIRPGEVTYLFPEDSSDSPFAPQPR